MNYVVDFLFVWMAPDLIIYFSLFEVTTSYFCQYSCVFSAHAAACATFSY